ncbi:MAG: TauD/TfdA family dioxygenase [Burkholderiaceae bacterium]
MLTTRPLHSDFGTEVLDFDPARLDEPGYFDALHQLFETRSVLVLRGQRMNDEQQVAFSRRFGPLEKTKTGTVGTGTPLVILTNLDEAGNVIAPSHRQWLEGLGNQLWHSDSSFKPIPALASILSARIIPAHGGETEFVSMRAAWQALPDKLRARVEGRVGVHDYAWSRSLISPDLMTDAEREELPPVRQAMVRVHPQTGEKGLYLGSHLARIEGMNDADGRSLIDELTAFATREGSSYTHRWQAGDIVIWDNRFVMHRGRPYAPTLKRLMVRTTVAGDGPTLGQTEEARAVAPASTGRPGVGL